ncbi:MAG: hypothetical protein ACKVP0_24430 [Pirellulaceae bacterium]
MRLLTRSVSEGEYASLYPHTSSPGPKKGAGGGQRGRSDYQENRAEKTGKCHFDDAQMLKKYLQRYNSPFRQEF